MTAQTIKASIGKAAEGLIQAAWFIFWFAWASAAIGLLARLAREAFVFGWRAWL